MTNFSTLRSSAAGSPVKATILMNSRGDCQVRNRKTKEYRIRKRAAEADGSRAVRRRNTPSRNRGGPFASVPGVDGDDSGRRSGARPASGSGGGRRVVGPGGHDESGDGG